MGRPGGISIRDWNKYTAVEGIAKASVDAIPACGHKLGTPSFQAKVLTTPIPLTPRQISAIIPGTPESGNDKVLVHTTFKGRIEELHWSIADPCDIAFAKVTDLRKVRKLISKHTSFIASTSAAERPAVGDIVEVKLKLDSTCQWNLQFGTYVAPVQHATATSSPQRKTCWSPMAVFKRNQAGVFFGGAGTTALTLDESICNQESPDFYLTHPLGRETSISSGQAFGMRFHPKLKAQKMHNGADISAVAGTPIYAAADGIISTIAFDEIDGNYVKITHTGAGQGFSTSYSHMVELPTMIKKRQEVKAGDLIGNVGSSGSSTGPHLHFGLRHAGNSVDPIPYIKTLQKCGAPSTSPAISDPINPSGNDSDPDPDELELTRGPRQMGGSTLDELLR
tara:strand:+ start:1284 stop:2465 length:1182 start_codon:yes stop_codon:yes gene_type:complete